MKCHFLNSRSHITKHISWKKPADHTPNHKILKRKKTKLPNAINSRPHSIPKTPGDSGNDSHSLKALTTFSTLWPNSLSRQFITTDGILHKSRLATLPAAPPLSPIIAQLDDNNACFQCITFTTLSLPTHPSFSVLFIIGHGGLIWWQTTSSLPVSHL